MNSCDETSDICDALALYKKQAQAFLLEPEIPYTKRIELLNAMESILIENDQDICKAISRDFGNRSVHETRLLELTPCLTGLRYTRRRLKKWMTPQRRHVSFLFTGGRNRVIPQAKGIVGIVTPWNYPLFLALSPMTSALAAGNRVMVKQAASGQGLCRLLDRLFAEKIPKEYICFAPGVGGSEFSGLPFDHLVFTGSAAVGKIVMTTAAQHLTPVTLELGGKSPVIVTDDFDLTVAVKRIMFAKCMNAGQTCIAPDYLFLPKEKEDAFIKTARTVVQKRYPTITTKDYTSIIDNKAFNRLEQILTDAREKGARVINLLDGPETDGQSRKMSPMIITRVNENMRIMKEEIFGPILPILTYENIEETFRYINSRQRPLALYLFSNNSSLADKMVRNTRSGGVTINDCAMHAAQHDMPFGGSGNSGMGHYHGYEGFLEFSKLRPVFRQFKYAPSLAPPYGTLVDKIYNSVRMFRWLS
ncbi:coniferyl aldehyde dehydrogenase [uncultured Desulfobacter sp.]|uniref:coniferyl aldehyde dehydrogenase n=1 Tax=uncultured Desulfobacter sp. TaxID=240139 RepID=UPI002AAAC5C1|nr:coniferyl aldehyde dehydrogenase [uncultured Desulfobacter sp.]